MRFDKYDLRIQNTNWDNFVNGCLTSKFTLLPSPEMLESILPLPACQTYASLCKSDLLIDQLLEYIPSVPTVLAKSAMHHDESIRVLALSGISKFLCKLIRTKCKQGNDKKKSVEFMLSSLPNLQIFMDAFLNCCTTFNNCSNPACRKQFEQIFSSLTESIRMICKSVCINGTELSLFLDKYNVNNNNNNANNKGVFCLQDTEIDSQVFYHLPSKFINEDIIMHQSCDDTAVVLCLDSLNNLQTLIDNISVKYNWDFKSVNSLRILFNGLLYLSSDVSQIMLMKLVNFL
ncbi:unnamed protein product [Trichobilharzia regenti]|nr:unnamed protein product [Trichobilharzia regenti]